jgi:hypothetical protein
MSQRKPYVTVSRGVIFQVSWPYSEKNGSAHCYGEDGSLGPGAFSLYVDGKGSLWAGLEAGLWRGKPGPPEILSAGALAERYTSLGGGC